MLSHVDNILILRYAEESETLDLIAKALMDRACDGLSGNVRIKDMPGLDRMAEMYFSFTKT